MNFTSSFCSIAGLLCSVSFWETLTSMRWSWPTGSTDPRTSFSMCSSSSLCYLTCFWPSSMTPTRRSRETRASRKTTLRWETTSRRWAHARICLFWSSPLCFHASSALHSSNENETRGILACGISLLSAHHVYQVGVFIKKLRTESHWSHSLNFEIAIGSPFVLVSHIAIFELDLGSSIEEDISFGFQFCFLLKVQTYLILLCFCNLIGVIFVLNKMIVWLQLWFNHNSIQPGYESDKLSSYGDPGAHLVFLCA